MKKIYLLKPRCIEWYSFIVFGIAWILYMGADEFDQIFVRISKFGYFELVWGIFFTFGAPVFLITLEWLGYRRELFYTTIDEKGYQSCRFRKKFCYVDKGKDIYYVLYHYPYYRMDFIAFSNEPFKLFQFVWISKKHLIFSFINTYDYRKVILLPYNEKTMVNFDVENWKKGEYIIDGQYNWKTKTIEVRREEE